MFAKLKDLEVVNVTEAQEVAFVKWENGQMARSEVMKPGYRADYKLTINSGETLSLTEAQMSKLLIACYADGKADIIGKRFNVKHNFVTKNFSDGEKVIDLVEFELSSGQDGDVATNNPADDLPDFN